MRQLTRDLFGIGWRSELAAQTLLHLDSIDVVEVMADDYAKTPRTWRPIETLAAQVPVVIHGVGLGLASAWPVDRRRLEIVGAFVRRIRPLFWSEHLAFVRAGGIEIGHLAAPPRTDAVIEAAAHNIRLAAEVVGSLPLLENVATLIDPPASRYDEPTWISRLLGRTHCDLLLDLHNVFANAVNFELDPLQTILALPADRIAAIHLAGGRRIQGGRVLDDHLHDVPEVVFDLLTEVGARVARPLTVLLERDGAYPAIDELLRQLERARLCLARGRARLHDPAGGRL